jgi:hypothetical protein
MKKILVTLLAAGSFFFANAQDTLQQYTGKYVFPDGSVVPDVDVVLSGGALSMASTAGTSSLTQLGSDSFQIVEFSGTAVFKRGDDKKVNAVHIEAMGYVLDGQKQNTGIWIFTAYRQPSNREMLLTKR